MGVPDRRRPVTAATPRRRYLPAVIGESHVIGTGYGIAAELEIALPAVDRETAEALVAKAHEVCPYSNATRGNITVDITILEVAA